MVGRAADPVFLISIACGVWLRKKGWTSVLIAGGIVGLVAFLMSMGLASGRGGLANPTRSFFVCLADGTLIAAVTSAIMLLKEKADNYNPPVTTAKDDEIDQQEATVHETKNVNEAPDQRPQRDHEPEFIPTRSNEKIDETKQTAGKPLVEELLSTKDRRIGFTILVIGIILMIIGDCAVGGYRHVWSWRFSTAMSESGGIIFYFGLLVSFFGLAYIYGLAKWISKGK